MKVFFGKFASTNSQFKKQIANRRYYAAQGSTWFNGIKAGDYCFILAGEDVYLWKAVGYIQDYLQFKEVIPGTLPMDTNAFKLFRYFQFNPQNIVLSSRQVRGKAFFEIQCVAGFTKKLLTDVKTYENEDNYRNIYIVDTQYKLNDKDIFLIKENNEYHLHKSSFIEGHTYASFSDNTSQYGTSGQQRSNKDSTITKIKETEINSSLQGVSLLSFYDLFFNEYKQDVEVDNLGKPIKGCELMTYPLNQILYGPPGTGKTYNTVKQAVDICTSKDDSFSACEQHSGEYDTSCYDCAKKAYKQLKNEGRIEFVTFHQSYGYEEFVEGIRAETLKDEDGNSTISYDVKPGMFRNICDAASVKVSSTTSTDIDVSQKEVWKMSLGNTQSGEDYIFQDCIDNGYVLLGYGDDIDFSDCRDRKGIKEKLVSKQGKDIDNQNYTLTSIDMFKHKMSQGDLIIISDGNHKFRAVAEVVGDYEFLADGNFCQMRKVKWLKSFTPSLPKERLFDKALSQMTLYKLREPTLNKEKLNKLLNSKEVTDPNDKPYVLIIDEINRGNMSKIFGELITLIEGDKRIGAANEMMVCLPVSGDEFGVPKNLHIIGTMNTADRSIAMMDTALRRRFEFKEMMPKPELLKGVTVKGVDIATMLETMNKRIEILYDREHTIGHAYFMPLRDDPSLNRLGSIFENKIIPLLSEYFFEEWEKIRMVLGDNQKQVEHQFITEEKANSNVFLGKLPNDFHLEDQNIFKRNSDALSLPKSYIGIYEAVAS